MTPSGDAIVDENNRLKIQTMGNFVLQEGF
jgi:hypothetical protein